MSEHVPIPPMPLRQGALCTRVRCITYLGEDINSYELNSLDGAALPPFTAGSHIDLYFRDGRVRQYSLCNDPSERHRYVFAVQREEHGRGGSKAIHEIVHVGRLMAISPPRNNFALHEEAEHHVLIAGGIGITPIKSMVHRLLATGASFELHYGARSQAKLAFAQELGALNLGERLHIYVDGGDPAKGMSPILISKQAPAKTHIYCCGPERLMRAVREATEGRPTGSVHFEHFTGEPVARVPSALMGNGDSIGVGFSVRLARSGLVLNVPDDKSIVQVLRENGVEVETSCEAGLCGTCRTRYLQGEPEHRDYVLEEEERRSEIMICCSRSKTPELVLDL